MGAGLKRFESEIAFLVRTFFFVFLGIIASISNVTLVLLGVALTFMLLIVRYGAVWLTTVGSDLRRESPIMTFILTRGLAAAVLATLPVQYGLKYLGAFINLAVVVILATAVIATVGVLARLRRVRASTQVI